MIYVIDTYAWAEYIDGSTKGEILRDLFNKKEDKFITLESTISEIKIFCLRKNIDFNRVYTLVKTKSVILPILRDHWINAAEIKFEMCKKVSNFGLIDSLLIAKQREHNCKIITGDTHFKNMKNVVFI